MRDTYSASDVARLLGISLDTLYRSRGWRESDDKMPPPISGRGKLRWEVSGFDAWLTRFHPLRAPAPANDAFAAPDPVSDDEHRSRLAAAYAPQTAPGGLDKARRIA